jgi:hypothetical protein
MAQREPVFPANRHALYEAHGYSAATLGASSPQRQIPV